MTEAMAKTHIQQLMETSNEVDELCNRKTVVPGIVQARFLQVYCFKKKIFTGIHSLWVGKKRREREGIKRELKIKGSYVGERKKRALHITISRKIACDDQCVF